MKNGGLSMSSELELLIERARAVQMSDPQKTQQRISFAYGTAKIENENITREMVEKVVRATAK